MRLYENLDVDLTYQNFGSCLLCILRGSTENIDLVFNGLYNLCATNGDYKFFDHANTVAMFWTTPERLERYFVNRGKEIRGRNRLSLSPEDYAKQQLELLRQFDHEFFIDFSNKFQPEIHGIGKVSAESPDMDFKDSVLTYAHKDNTLCSKCDIAN